MQGTLVMTERKSRKGKRADQRRSRKGDRSANDLRSEATRLRKYVEAIEAAATALDENTVDYADVDGVNYFDRGVASLEAYVVKVDGAVSAAISKQRFNDS